MTEALGKNVIHISIHQESSLSSLFKALGQCCPRRKEDDPKPALQSSASLTKNHGSGEQKVLGGTQILLGIVCFSLGVVLGYKELFPDNMYSAAFWMGGLFVVSGILSVLSGTFGSYWVGLATVFHLTSVVAGCMALVQGIVPIPGSIFDFEYRKSLCEFTEPQPWNTVTPPYRRWGPSRDTDWRETECKQVLRSGLASAFAVRILLFVFSVVAIGNALFCFACGVRVLYQRLKASCDTYVPLGDQIPPPSENQASTEHTA